MNKEQLNSVIRSALVFVAGILAGNGFISKFFTPDQVVSLLTNDTVIQLISSLVVGGAAAFWGFFSKTSKNQVAAVNELPEVKGVIMQPTTEGAAIAQAIPSPTVTTAGTTTAQDVAAKP